MLRWWENNDVRYLVGLARNNRVTELLQPTLDQAEVSFQSTGKKQHHFTWLHYQAGTWDRPFMNNPGYYRRQAEQLGFALSPVGG